MTLYDRLAVPVDPAAVRKRPGWDKYFVGVAEAVAARADCRRRRFGAVVVKDHRVVSIGYNGSPSGQPSCLAGECPRGLLSHAVAPLGGHGKGGSLCIAVHAEANALLYASRSDTELATVYLWTDKESGEPCIGCWRLIMGAGVIRVVFPHQGHLCAVTDLEFEDIQQDGRLERIASQSG